MWKEELQQRGLELQQWWNRSRMLERRAATGNRKIELVLE
jgi:hypothetical protein